MDEAVNKTKEILINSITKSLKNVTELAVPFSGSLDSSLIAFLAKKYSQAKITLYTIGFEGCYDFEQSFSAYQLITKSTDNPIGQSAEKQINYKKINLTDIDLITNLDEYLNLTNDTYKVSISYTLPFFILLKNIKKDFVMTGHGADTLFGGFHKYLKAQNLKLKIQSCYNEFITNLPKREYLAAKHFNKNLIVPFADEKLAEYVLSLPDDYLIRNGVRKFLLRKVAIEAGLPKKLAKKPKKAIQYSTKVMKHLRKIDRYRNL